MKPELILVTNGYSGNWPAAQYCAWLAKKMQAIVNLVGVVERNDNQHPLEDFFSDVIGLFQREGIEYHIDIYNSELDDLIPVLARERKDSLFIFGRFGRQFLKRLVSGSRFRNIMAQVSSPIFYIPELYVPPQKVLICLGGLGYTITAEHLGMQVAEFSGASVTLLSVIPPIDLDYPESRALRDNWKKISETNTLPGKSIRQALEAAQSMGIKASLHIRQGNVVEEILAEIKNGGYDLVCMGSTYSAHGLRHMLTPNVTAEVAETVNVPILTARYKEPENGQA